jgi:hypothetical protein
VDRVDCVPPSLSQPRLPWKRQLFYFYLPTPFSIAISISIAIAIFYLLRQHPSSLYDPENSASFASIRHLPTKFAILVMRNG